MQVLSWNDSDFPQFFGKETAVTIGSFDGLHKGHRVLIGNTDALGIAEELGGMLKERYGEKLRIQYVTVNPTAGSHCGPNGVGVCFHAKHR